MKDKGKKKFDPKAIYVVSTALLGGWFCVHEDVSEDEAMETLWELINAGGMILEIPTDDKGLFRDRLFGGWSCEDPERRHVYFAQSHYTFLSRDQSPMTEKDRASFFRTIYDANKKSHFIGSNKFMKGCQIKLENK